MAQPIPSKHHHAIPSSQPSTHLVTPSGTPPTGPISDQYASVTESRLHQLLSNFDAGTHTIDREDRESPAERRMSFGSAASEVFPTPPSSRRASFLSSLGIRPFTFTSSPSNAAGTPLTASHPKDSFAGNMGHGMTATTEIIESGPVPNRPSLDRNVIQSAPHLPPLPAPAHDRSEPMDLSLNPVPGNMSRSKTTGSVSTKQSGFVLKKGDQPAAVIPAVEAEKKQHFDPSRDPRLLGLI